MLARLTDPQLSYLSWQPFISTQGQRSTFVVIVAKIIFTITTKPCHFPQLQLKPIPVQLIRDCLHSMVKSFTVVTQQLTIVKFLKQLKPILPQLTMDCLHSMASSLMVPQQPKVVDQHL